MQIPPHCTRRIIANVALSCRMFSGVPKPSARFHPNKNLRPEGLENLSEDGSWEGSVDCWWPRPRSPTPGAAAGGHSSFHPPPDGDFSGAYDYGFSSSPGGALVRDPDDNHHHLAHASACYDYQGHWTGSDHHNRQQPGSLLPAVPTFEESGTRVSWADYRGHRLAEVGKRVGGG